MGYLHHTTSFHVSGIIVKEGIKIFIKSRSVENYKETIFSRYRRTAMNRYVLTTLVTIIKGLQKLIPDRMTLWREEISMKYQTLLSGYW